MPNVLDHRDGLPVTASSEASNRAASDRRAACEDDVARRRVERVLAVLDDDLLLARIDRRPLRARRRLR
jgi:hypothetical protein